MTASRTRSPLPHRPAAAPAKRGRVKLADVAAASGVHSSTVSRVLRADPDVRVSKAVAAKIRETAERLGYVPDLLASGMRTKSTRLIGVIVHDLADPVYPPILRGIETVLGREGLMMVVGNTGYDVDAEVEMFDQMAARMIDGVIFGTTRLEDPLVERAVQAGTPTVSLLRRTEHDHCSAVVNDCFGGMAELVDAIAARGFRDVAAIAAPQTLSSARERLDGLRTGLAAHGIELRPDRLEFVSRMNPEEGHRAALALFERRELPPEIIVAVNDLVAIGAIQACQERGLSCPRDISVTGYNDIPLLDMLDPPIATVALDLPRIGALCGELLIERIRDPGPARIIRVKPRVILRRSLGAPRGQAPGL